jgi:hypothetical protein
MTRPVRRSVAGWLYVAMIAGQLAILEIKELREQGSALVRDHAFFGYAPNLLAALTLPCLFLALSLKPGNPDEPYRWARLWRENAALLRALLLTVGGLLAWEFIQPYRPNRTFDWQDVWATLAGGLLFLLVVLAARRATPEIPPVEMSPETPVRAAVPPASAPQDDLP